MMLDITSMVSSGLSGLLSSATGGSQWDGLNRHLLATFYEVDSTGKRLSNYVVQAPLADDAQLEIELNWQSPFESAGTDSQAPALTALAQSGMLQMLVEKVAEKLGVDSGKVGDVASGVKGRSGMTKLNSTQVFNGMPPIKITCEVLLRAWSNPEIEVEAPLNQLVSWSLPKKIAAEGTMATAAFDVTSGDKGLLEAAFPSEVPSMIAMVYKGRTYSPLVIERVGVPLNSPIDSSGRFVSMKIPLSLATLTAKDRDDWKAMRSSLL